MEDHLSVKEEMIDTLQKEQTQLENDFHKVSEDYLKLQEKAMLTTEIERLEKIREEEHLLEEKREAQKKAAIEEKVIYIYIFFFYFYFLLKKKKNLTYKQANEEAKLVRTQSQSMLLTEEEWIQHLRLENKELQKQVKKYLNLKSCKFCFFF
ncbi:hypothetical protein RFI_03361 [Reticulomyxa filosa]|uniref:Uncharacterized protein n=1 Tax=Reticulomyxa filosa TaxID=46433 RepID=X6P5B2_RETFI|nr:hypothetical protein RFI_03361 [Reticulomyxa filosa]|eukprot:ETO33740.1 hypothetical protein RFI_03361 [Reticulomyxa filosa]